MRNHRGAVGFLFLVAAAVAGCGQSSGRSDTPSESARPGVSDTAAARQAIAKLNAEFSNLATTRNSDSVAAWFAADAMIMASGAPTIQSRDSIRTFYDQFFSVMPIREMTFATEDLTFTGDVAIETGKSVLSLAGPGQATPVSVTGKYLAVWKRQSDGRWLLWRYAPSNNALPR